MNGEDTSRIHPLAKGFMLVEIGGSAAMTAIVLVYAEEIFKDKMLLLEQMFCRVARDSSSLSCIQGKNL